MSARGNLQASSLCAESIFCVPAIHLISGVTVSDTGLRPHATCRPAVPGGASLGAARFDTDHDGDLDKEDLGRRDGNTYVPVDRDGHV